MEISFWDDLITEIKIQDHMENTSQHCVGLIVGAQKKKVAEKEALQSGDQVFILARLLVSVLTLDIILNSLGSTALATGDSNSNYLRTRGKDLIIF